jgi:hypothetical protein
VIDCLEWNDKDKFRLRYNAMCQRVAQYSADAFNQNLAGALGTNLRSSTLENIVKQFFRIDVVPYLLTGLDHHRLFAVEIPALTSWKQDWKLAGVLAQPDLASGQSVVDIRVTVENKATHAKHSVKFHVEVRWSHGKFCGNPEGKLYKEFCWTDVPFLGRIV